MAAPSAAEWFLIPAGFLAGVINVVAGGGSFLILPLLVASGLSLSVANGTNRVAVVLQALIATGLYSKQGALDRRLFSRMLPPLLIGSILGAWLATQLDPKSLERSFGVLFVLMALFLGQGETLARFGVRWPRVSRWLSLPSLFGVGVYGGFLQAGVGLWIVTAAVAFFGSDAARANGVKIPLVLAFTIPSLLIFTSSGQVDLRRGLLLGIGTALGAIVGVRVALWGGSKFILRLTLAGMVLTGVGLILRG